MAVSKGKLLLVKKNGTALAGDNNATITEEGGLIEYRTKGMDGTGREYDDKSCTIQFEALVDVTDGTLVALQDARYSQTKLTDITAVTALGTYSGTWLVETFDTKGEVAGMQTASGTMKSDGGYTFTAA